MKNTKNKGQVLLVVAVLFTIVTTAGIVGVSSPIVRQIQIARNLELSKKSYFAAEAGSEDAFYKIKNNLATSFPESLTLDDSEISISSTITGAGEQEVTSRAETNNHVRTVLKDVTVTDGFSFSFALQVGIGGLIMENNSQVVGNVYANGPIQGSGASANIIRGDAVSAGSSGSISGVRATSSAYAHTISNSTVDRDAYFTSISNTTVGGTQYPGSADQPTVAMPIPDSLLDQWEQAAVDGGTINSPCPYNISSGVVHLGPAKINCSLTISGNATEVHLDGPVFVNGNLTVNNNPRIKVSDTVGNKSVPIITRSISSPTSAGTITLNNNPLFYGSESNGAPNPDSYVMLVSRNTSASVGGSVKAITAGNNITGNLLVYAPYGEIEIANNAVLRQVTAHRLRIKNNTIIYYTIGLAQPLFVEGPGGEWKISRWREGQ
jgi:hypothetical protein